MDLEKIYNDDRPNKQQERLLAGILIELVKIREMVDERFFKLEPVSETKNEGIIAQLNEIIPDTTGYEPDKKAIPKKKPIKKKTTTSKKGK